MRHLILWSLLMLSMSVIDVSAQDGIEQCNGFMPSRLKIGQLARVTPGEANNVRDEPESSAELVRQIPGGGVFEVLAGTVCSDEGAWWQVSYQQEIGWTLEGRGNVYWTER